MGGGRSSGLVAIREFGEQWLGTERISKVELTGLAEGLDAGREEREEANMTPWFFREQPGGWHCRSLRCGHHTGSVKH